MSYTTETAVENYLMVTIDASFSSQITEWINAVTAFIEKYTGKVFEQVAATTKYFDGNGKRSLILSHEDDLISVTSLKVLNEDGTEIASLTEGADKDYLLYPLNSTPKSEIRMTTYCSVGGFYKGNKTISITGTWGNSASVPADVKLAATMMLAEIIRPGKDGGNGKITSLSLGDYQVAYAQNGGMEGMLERSGAKDLLDHYKEYEF